MNNHPSLHSPRLEHLFSVTKPNLLTEWLDPVTITILVLIGYIKSTPAAPSIHLKSLLWCKGRKGIRHEFMVVEIERPQSNMWLRLDRRVHQDSALIELVSSTAAPADSVRMLFWLYQVYNRSLLTSTRYDYRPRSARILHIYSTNREARSSFQVHLTSHPHCSA
jgi:hypothetical protein